MNWSHSICGKLKNHAQKQDALEKLESAGISDWTLRVSSYLSTERFFKHQEQLKHHYVVLSGYIPVLK